jgi:hypothetical protein
VTGVSRCRRVALSFHWIQQGGKGEWWKEGAGRRFGASATQQQKSLLTPGRLPLCDAPAPAVFVYNVFTGELCL